MNARIRLSGQDVPTELVELAEWMSREDEFRGRVEVEQPEVRPGEMGGAAEVLVVALGAQGAGTALAASLSIWIKHRRPSVDIEVTNSDGRSVKLSVRDFDVADLGELLRQVLER